MKRASLCILFVFVFISSFIAAPLKNVPVTVTQPNGTVLHIFASGDEFHNWLHDKEGYTIVQDGKSGWYEYAMQLTDSKVAPSGYRVGEVNPESVGLQKGVNISASQMQRRKELHFQNTPSSITSAPTKGTINNIVIFIRFDDEDEFNNGISKYSGMFNGAGITTNSMYHYFYEASYEMLEIHSHFYPEPSGTQIVSYRDIYPRAYYQPYSENNVNGYHENEAGAREHALLKRAVDAVEHQISNDLVIDSDGDDYVDNVCFIISGSPTGWSELLWPHRWVLYGEDVYINGRRVYDYNFQLETSLESSGNGVLCHEMFHSLGAPDLYHYTGNGIAPAGAWDLMQSASNPPPHMTAYMKYRYGKWIDDIPSLDSSGTYYLHPVAEPNQNCFKIASPKSQHEYFVVEYRKKSGTFESSLPGSGLTVLRIDSRKHGVGNAGGPPDELYIYRPNGTVTNNGDDTHAHFSENTGRTEFNHATNPIPFLSNGRYGGLDLSDIGSVGDSISFTLNIINSLLAMNPNGGEYLEIGSELSISWQDFGKIDYIAIDYSTDNGEYWIPVADSIKVNDARYWWEVPNTPSYTCLIRIRDMFDSTFYDLSDETFAILPSGNFHCSEVASFFVGGTALDIKVHNNHAYVACGSAGLEIYSLLSNEKVGAFNTPGNATGIYVNDKYAFIADGSDGLRIISITDPDNLHEIGFYDTPGTAVDVIVKDTLVFVADKSEGLRIISISDIENPVEVDNISFQGFAKGLDIKDNFIYVAAENGGVRIIDYTIPTQVNAFKTPGWTNDLVISGDLLYVADGNEGLGVYNVADNFIPYEIGRTNTRATGEAIALHQHFAYIADMTGGLRILDISIPSAPIEVGFYDSPGLASGVAVHHNKVLLADFLPTVSILENQLVTSVDNDTYEIPTDYILYQNYPNPFNPQTTITYSLPKSTKVKLVVYDVLGRVVTTLVDEVQEAGIHTTEVSSEITSQLTSGVYFYRLVTNHYTKTKKMLLLK